MVMMICNYNWSQHLYCILENLHLNQETSKMITRTSNQALSDTDVVWRGAWRFLSPEKKMFSRHWKTVGSHIALLQDALVRWEFWCSSLDVQTQLNVSSCRVLSHPCACNLDHSKKMLIMIWPLHCSAFKFESTWDWSCVMRSTPVQSMKRLSGHGFGIVLAIGIALFTRCCAFTLV